MKHRGARFFTVVVISAFVALSTYAFTASNTVPATKAGSGSNTVTGYTLTAVDYTLGTTPTSLSSITFKLDGNVASTTNIKVQTDTPSGAWTDCTAGTFDSTNNVTPVSCTVTDSVANADQLSVVVAP